MNLRNADLDDDPGPPPEVVADLERAARRLGLPLATREALRTDGALCRAFASAWRRGALDPMLSFARLADAGFDADDEVRVRRAFHAPPRHHAIAAQQGGAWPASPLPA